MAKNPKLTRERIVHAAIGLVETEGLSALSMARLADQLGCVPMALYRHVSNKDELQALMTDAAPGAPPVLAADDWVDGLTQWTRALRSVYVRHPWILQMPVSGPPLEPGQLAWLDCGLRALGPTRLPLADQLSVMLTLLYYVRGEAQLSIGLRAASRGGRRDASAYGKRIAQLIDAERLPALASVIAAGVFRHVDADTSADDFEFGLARIFDGVGALIRSRKRKSARRSRR